MSKRAVWAIAMLVLLGTAMGFAQAIHRPINDFLETQIYTTRWFDANHPDWYVIIDYAGVNANWLLTQGVNIGTKLDGDIVERPLPDGTALVQVVLHGRNVFTRVYNPFGEDGPVDFMGGTRVAVRDGVTPGLGEMLFKLEFINPDGMGAPLPELFFGIAPESILSWSMVFKGKGPLHEAVGVPEGTPGMVETTQINRPHSGKGVPGKDYWPAEHVLVKAIGH